MRAKRKSPDSPIEGQEAALPQNLAISLNKYLNSLAGFNGLDTEKLRTHFKEQKSLDELVQVNEGLEKQVTDQILADRFPHWDNPINRQRNMELLMQMHAVAVNWEDFINYVIEFQRQALLDDMLARYADYLKQDDQKVNLQRMILQLLQSEQFKKLEIYHRIITLQAEIFKLGNEIKQIYRELGTTFKDTFEKLIDPTNPDRSIKVDIPKVGEVDLNFNELAKYVGNQVGDRIARGEVEMSPEGLKRAAGEAVFDYAEMMSPTIRKAYAGKERPAIDIPEFRQCYVSFINDASPQISILNPKIDTLKNLEKQKKILESEDTVKEADKVENLNIVNNPTKVSGFSMFKQASKARAEKIIAKPEKKDVAAPNPENAEPPPPPAEKKHEPGRF